MNDFERLGAKRSANRRFWSVTIVLLYLGLAGFLVSGVLYGNALFLISMSFFILTLPAYCQFLSKERELFSPLNLVFLNLLIGVLLQTTMVALNLDQSRTLNLDVNFKFDVITTGMLAMGIAIFFLLVGYSFSPDSYKYVNRKPNIRPASDWARGRMLLLFVVFGGITLLSVVYFVLSFDILSDLTRFSVKRQSTDGGSAGILRFGMRFSQVACMVLFAYHLACKREGIRSGMMLYIIILFLLASAGPFLSSSRSLLLYFLIALFAVHHFSTGGWKINNVRNAVVVVVFIVVAMGALRYIQQRSVSYQTFNEEVGFVGSLSKLASSNNFLGIKKTAVLLDMVPSQVDHTYGSTYLLWAITPVPRAWWPEKPVVRIGGVLGAQVFGTRDTNGIPPGFVGEAYLNFSWFGIPLVAFLFGAGIRLFFEKFGRKAYHDPKAMLIYAALFAPVVFGGVSSDFTGFVSRSAQILIPLLIALKIVKAFGVRRTKVG